MSRRRNSSRRKLNGIFLLDKPCGASSNRVLQQVKRHFNADKAGHTGTLDPLATGMLPLCFGEATKLSQYLIDANKGYETTLVMGVTTDSLDADGTITSEQALPGDLDLAGFSQTCKGFVGEQQQIPPMVSAIKVDGQRLYKLARSGVTVERKPRSIVIESLEVLSFNPPEAVIRVVCSKGTYIRSLVDDIGRQLGCGAHVKTLRRTFVAPFEGRTMTSIEELEASTDADSLILPMDVAITHIPSVSLQPTAISAFHQGRTLPWSDLLRSDPELSGSDRAEAEQLVRIYADDGLSLIGLGRVNELGEIAPKRVFQLD